MQGLNKPGTHAHFKHSGRYACFHVLLSSLRHSAIYSCPCGTWVRVNNSNNSNATLQHTKHCFRLPGVVSDTKNLLATPVYIELHESLDWKIQSLAYSLINSWIFITYGLTNRPIHVCTVVYYLWFLPTGWPSPGTSNSLGPKSVPYLLCFAVPPSRVRR